MTPEEYYKLLGRMTSSYADVVRVELYVRGANMLLANIKNRIQRRGQDSNLRDLLPYSTKPGYYTKDKFVRKSSFKAIGKDGFRGDRLIRSKNYSVVTQKNGRERLVRDKTFEVQRNKPKSMYLQNGYKQLRQIQGMPTDIKNLTYSGSTMAAFVVGRDGNTILIGFNQKKASRIRHYQEQINRGKIYSASSLEIGKLREYLKSAELEIIRRLYTP